MLQTEDLLPRCTAAAVPLAQYADGATTAAQLLEPCDLSLLTYRSADDPTGDGILRFIDNLMDIIIRILAAIEYRPQRGARMEARDDRCVVALIDRLEQLAIDDRIDAMRTRVIRRTDAQNALARAGQELLLAYLEATLNKWHAIQRFRHEVSLPV